MSAFVGYYVDGHDDEGVPIAAGIDEKQVTQDTITRGLALIASSLPIHIFINDYMQVQERDITPADAEKLDQLCSNYFNQVGEQKIERQDENETESRSAGS